MENGFLKEPKIRFFLRENLDLCENGKEKEEEGRREKEEEKGRRRRKAGKEEEVER